NRRAALRRLTPAATRHTLLICQVCIRILASPNCTTRLARAISSASRAGSGSEGRGKLSRPGALVFPSPVYNFWRLPPRAPAPEFSDAGSEEEHMHISALYESVTNSIIADLEKGVASWVKPWKNGNTGGILPMNAATKRSYNGINIPILWHAQLSRGYPTASWMTYKQALERGAQVRGAEKSTHVVFTKQLNVKDKETDEEKKIGMLKAYSVFNVAQIDGVPASTIGQVEETPGQKQDKVDTFIAA